MDKDKIFFLFEDNNDESNSSEIDIVFEEEEEIILKIRMFCKLIQNNTSFQLQLKKFFNKLEKEYDEDTVKSSSDFTTYTRAWFYIKQLNIELEKHIKAINNQDNLEFYKCLDQSIIYFEKLEDYEKCAHLYKIQKLLKKGQK